MNSRDHFPATMARLIQEFFKAVSKARFEVAPSKGAWAVRSRFTTFGFLLLLL
ncbi:MAG TPA: hypothetical protein PKA27_10210 [Fimbriimonadaceae bacterium]|nr:hypothetical protein [Fimbriimonadaceae bacterium]